MDDWETPLVFGRGRARGHIRIERISTTQRDTLDFRMTPEVPSLFHFDETSDVDSGNKDDGWSSSIVGDDEFSLSSKSSCGGEKVTKRAYNRKEDKRESPASDEPKKLEAERSNAAKPTAKTSVEMRRFWIENKLLELPAIVHESNEVWEETDVKFYAGELLGNNEDVEPVVETSLDPVLPMRIYQGVDGRYYTVVAGPVQLPEKFRIETRLLYIDAEDVLYMRQHKEDYQRRREGSKIVTLQQLLSNMKSFYSVFRNYANFCISRTWFPNIGEVVVVKIQRFMPTELAEDGYFSQTEYQRARVTAIEEDGLVVELLDDYGAGGVPYTNVLRIAGSFAQLPAQVFCCELAEIGMINVRKLVQTIVRDSPIQNCWSDSHMISVGTTWLGEWSDSNRPLVEAVIQLRSSRSISLKTHVYRSLQCVLSPYIHLVGSPGQPHFRAIDADKYGFLWVRFLKDDELYARMQFALEKLIPCYHKLSGLFRLNVEMLLPRDDRKRCRLNKKKFFAVLLPAQDENSETGNSKMLYRVTIKDADRLTNKVKVYCIDHHSTHEVDSWELVPLYNLYPDLSYIPPLVFRVHLFPIKNLDKDADGVKNLLYEGALKMKLVHEWPRNVYPPEVFIDSSQSFENDADYEEVVRRKQENPDEHSMQGYARLFVTKEWATTLSIREMQVLSQMITEHVEKLDKKAEDEIKYTSFENIKYKERQEYLAAFTFVNENYKWNNYGGIVDGSVITDVPTSGCTTASYVSSINVLDWHRWIFY